MNRSALTCLKSARVGHFSSSVDTMIAFEKVLLQEKPDWVAVVGDVNATLACSVAAKKLCIKVCHIICTGIFGYHFFYKDRDVAHVSSAAVSVFAQQYH